MLAYGLGDLQDAGWLPGHAWIAFDLTAHIDPSSWWASVITGVTELSPKMTVLQVTAWLAYLVVVIPAFVSAGRSAPASRAARARTQATAEPRPGRAAPGPRPSAPSSWERVAGGRPWLVAGVLVAVPAVAAGVTIAALPAAATSAASTVTVTAPTARRSGRPPSRAPRRSR